MRVIRSVRAMQRLALQWRRGGQRIGLVPTMGYLHPGHLSLVERGRKRIGRRGVLVVSIYVNPTQFGPNEDFGSYPRDFARDLELCRTAGVDVIFAPVDREMYPGRQEGCYSTYVVEEALTHGMEGASRPGHFRGVATVVAKLFNIVQPDVAVFGAKDFQQAAIIRRMVADLNFPLRVVVAPTLRETDGLAMSSRNKYLNASQRTQAVALSKAIRLARATVRKNRHPISATSLKGRLTRFIEREPEARVDYIEFFNAGTLIPAKSVSPGTHLALAVFVGRTRLIDNGRL